jgi:hypothetical protein
VSAQGWSELLAHTAIFDMPKPFSRQWVERKVPQMDEAVHAGDCPVVTD